MFKAHPIAQDPQQPIDYEENIPATIKIASMNCLVDTWSPEKIFSLDRWQRQLQEFEAQQFDILCLNEVTPGYLQMILQANFVKQQYYVFCDPHVKDFGNVILSKLPILESHSYIFNEEKFKRDCLLVIVDVPTSGKNIKLGLFSLHLKVHYNFFNNLFFIRLVPIRTGCAESNSKKFNNHWNKSVKICVTN